MVKEKGICKATSGCNQQISFGTGVYPNCGAKDPLRTGHKD